MFLTKLKYILYFSFWVEAEILEYDRKKIVNPVT